MDRKNIVKGKAMSDITGVNDPEKQIKLLTEQGIHFWQDVNGRPVTIKDNLMPGHRDRKSKQEPKESKLRLVDRG